MKSFNLFATIVVMLAVSLSACQAPKPFVSTLSSPLQPPATMGNAPADLIPTGHVQVGESFSSDLDGDGVIEVAVAYTAAGEAPGGGILVAKPGRENYAITWQQSVPDDVRVTSLETHDMLSTGRYSLLVFGQVVDSTRFPLYVYRWKDDGFVTYTPMGGALDGQAEFTSDYWPTTLGDVDDDGVMEIVPTVEFDPPREYLEPLVYQWDGEQYTFTDYYIVPPRFKPEK